MSTNNFDIKDDEIRVISSCNRSIKLDEDQICAPKQSVVPSSNKQAVSVNSRKRRRIRLTILAAIAVGIVLGLSFGVFSPSAPKDGLTIINVPEVSDTPVLSDVAETESETAFAVCTDTIVNGVKLTFLTPWNSTPTLEIGNGVINDPSVILAVQAADVRGDNGQIAGTFVVNGELVSKGEAKTGFCSIINGKITIGVAVATPMLEEALTSEGYFFRQYPLVVGGQIVENKPKGKAVRKALAETKDGISVVISDDRLTFHDFSQALADAGVKNAIYLVGGNSTGCYTDLEGYRFTFGKNLDNQLENVNFIVWR